MIQVHATAVLRVALSLKLFSVTFIHYIATIKTFRQKQEDDVLENVQSTTCEFVIFNSEVGIFYDVCSSKTQRLQLQSKILAQAFGNKLLLS